MSNKLYRKCSISKSFREIEIECDSETGNDLLTVAGKEDPIL